MLAPILKVTFPKKREKIVAISSTHQKMHKLHANMTYMVSNAFLQLDKSFDTTFNSS